MFLRTRFMFGVKKDNNNNHSNNHNGHSEKTSVKISLRYRTLSL